ncbi:hypothetical protein AB0885_12010, partial [Streptomyces sp. NPDC005534]
GPDGLREGRQPGTRKRGVHEHGSAPRRPSAASLRPTVVRAPAAPGSWPGAHGHSGTRRDAGAPAVLAPRSVRASLDDTPRAPLRTAFVVLRASLRTAFGTRRTRAGLALVRLPAGPAAPGDPARSGDPAGRDVPADAGRPAARPRYPGS